MLDKFLIFSFGGRVIFSHKFDCEIEGEPVNELISNILIEDRTGSVKEYVHENYKMKWQIENEFELVFVVVYQRMLQLFYLDKLLELLQENFLNFAREQINKLDNPNKFALSPSFFSLNKLKLPDFRPHFLQILEQVEEYDKRQKVATKMRTFDKTDKYKNTVTAVKDKDGVGKKNKKKKNKNQNDQDEESDSEESNSESNSPSLTKKKKISKSAKRIKKLQERQKSGGRSPKRNLRRRGRGRGGRGGRGSKSKKKIDEKPQKKIKKPMKWDNTLTKSERRELDQGEKLDQMQMKEISKQNSQKLIGDKKLNLDFSASEGEDDDDYWELSNDEEESIDEEEEEEEKEGFKVNLDSLKKKKKSNETKKKKKGKVANFFKGLKGNKELDEETLEPILEKFRDHLISRNVDSEIAQKISDSVLLGLKGKQIGTFQRVVKIVREKIEEVLIKILTPKRVVNILRDIGISKKKKEPYSIVFVGVNGTGKSTSLAKTCYWLLQNNFTVLIAACDTFRSGAVDQLRVHSNVLGVPLFEWGYGKPPANIAQKAIAHAKSNNIDVVLIDTAGRMQDNELQMRALANLIELNKPNFVAFVGEALVGNIGKDQLIKFNQGISDYSKTNKTQLINGIFLTKFDTIDDKVGAALSMTYSSGIPIVFLGVGQQYVDLKKMDVKMISKTLIKN
ncbi:signal recognition particle receptor subunit alpha [Anaeramoeba flamelloides]|uniref:Signal recognition particle receptor subunit alpha n=1 Tax=Anaeramoeba flamelloides TaxID=1746091 RepID=A0AAV7Z214_9EUKA|nr:signal recognition particle receptor subunit alpha [Anaeramoeba flamelloides]